MAVFDLGWLGLILVIPAGLFGRYALLNWPLLIEALKTTLTGSYTLTSIVFSIPLPVMEIPKTIFDWLFLAYMVGVAIMLLRYLLAYIRLRFALGKGTSANGKRSEQIRAVANQYVPQEEWFRHEDVFPPIISRTEWDQAQALLQKQCRKREKSNAPYHRYAGLLACSECGSPFVAINRYWNGNFRVEYICKSYMRYGKDTCSSHRIREEVLDQMVRECLAKIHESNVQEFTQLKLLQKRRVLKEPALNARRLMLANRLWELELEVDNILIQKIQENNEPPT